MFEELKLGNKTIYIVESHHYVLLAWDKIKSSISEDPYLITLDYHTDTNEAFKQISYLRTKPDFTNAANIQKELIQNFLLSNSNLKDMVSLLNNDEHIDAAIKKGLISHAFSINHMDSSGTLSIEENEYNRKISEDIELRLFGGLPKPQKPYNYLKSFNGIFLIPHQSVVDDNATCDIDYFAIDDCFLHTQVKNILQICSTSGLQDLNQHPFVLDIDLDYFRTVRSIKPLNTTVFYDLIRKSSAITIAKESGWVLKNRIDNEITSEYLLQLLLNNIKGALN